MGCGYNVEQLFLANFPIVVYSCIKSGGKWWKVPRSGRKVAEDVRPPQRSWFFPRYGSW